MKVLPQDVMTIDDIAAVLRCTADDVDLMWRVDQVMPPPHFMHGPTVIWETATFKAWFHLWPSYIVHRIRKRLEQGVILPPLVIGNLGLSELKFIDAPNPADRPRISHQCRTYFIRSEAGGPIKIGKAVNVQKRLSSLQTSHSQKLYVLAEIEVDRESELHERFAELRTKGEWFRAEKPLLDFLHDECGVAVASL